MPNLGRLPQKCDSLSYGHKDLKSPPILQKIDTKGRVYVGRIVQKNSEASTASEFSHCMMGKQMRLQAIDLFDGETCVFGYEF